MLLQAHSQGTLHCLIGGRPFHICCTFLRRDVLESLVPPGPEHKISKANAWFIICSGSKAHAGMVSGFSRRVSCTLKLHAVLSLYLKLNAMMSKSQKLNAVVEIERCVVAASATYTGCELSFELACHWLAWPDLSWMNAALSLSLKLNAEQSLSLK